MVGKGLEMSVLAELFFYAAVTMVPMALPLAILLASLMTFGNLGERLELLADKGGGYFFAPNHAAVGYFSYICCYRGFLFPE